MWCPVEFCNAKQGRAKTYTFIYKMWVSEWPSYGTLLHWFTIPPVPWCIARLYLYIHTKLDGILSWADINKNGNRFFEFAEDRGRFSNSSRVTGATSSRMWRPSDWCRSQILNFKNRISISGDMANFVNWSLFIHFSHVVWCMTTKKAAKTFFCEGVLD